MSLTPTCRRIFLTFLRLGLTAFGGPAALPAMRRRIVDELAWLSPTDFDAAAEFGCVIPGATVLQTAVYAGWRSQGAAGALAAALGYSLPALAVMTLFSLFYPRILAMPHAPGAFQGLAVMMAALCFTAGADVLRRSTGAWIQKAVAGGAAIMFLIGIKAFSLVMAGAILGVLLIEGGPDRADASGSPEGAPGPDEPERTGLLPGAAREDVTREETTTMAVDRTGSGARPYSWKLPVGLVGLLACFLGVLFLLDPALGKLAAVMVKVDLQSFGGFGAVPVLFSDVVRASRHWLDQKTFLDAVALTQLSPGPVLAASAFVGFQVKGLAGALAAWAGALAPSILFVLAVAPARDAVLGCAWAKKAVAGVQSALGGCILASGLLFARELPWDPAHLGLGVAALALTVLALRGKTAMPLAALACAAGGAFLF